MVLIAHLSDTHFDTTERARERVSRVMRFLGSLSTRPDVIVVTGDITDHGLPAEYAEARAGLRAEVPVLLCPGNHDVRAAYRAGLLDQPGGDEPVNELRTVAGVTFALCDSTIPGEAGGYLADETLAWLDESLSTGDEPALVCFHHPPTVLHHSELDPIRQHGGERLAEVLARHARVLGVLTGHAHSAATTTFAGLPLLIAPGIRSTLRMPWENAPWIDDSLPPGLAFHILDDDRRLTTHYRVLP